VEVHTGITWQIQLNDICTAVMSESDTGDGNAAYSQISLGNLLIVVIIRPCHMCTVHRCSLLLEIAHRKVDVSLCVLDTM